MVVGVDNRFFTIGIFYNFTPYFQIFNQLLLVLRLGIFSISRIGEDLRSQVLHSLKIISLGSQGLHQLCKMIGTTDKIMLLALSQNSSKCLSALRFPIVARMTTNSNGIVLFPMLRLSHLISSRF